MKRKPFRIVLVSDMHAGERHSLRYKPETKTQRVLLDRWGECVDRWHAPDLLISAGDSIAGQDPKTLDVEQTDIPWQVSEAADLLRMWDAKRIAIIEGTPYHTGQTVQLEKFLAAQLNCADTPTEFHSKLRLKVRGWFKLQGRHKIGRSVVPYGVHTTPGRSQMWQVLNAALEARYTGERVTWPHVSVFGHVHYWSYAETALGGAMTLPCWSAIGSRYGETQCDGHIDLGAVCIEVHNNEEEGWTWEKRLYPARVEHHTVSL